MALTNDIAEFCDLHGACTDGREWALANCTSMADAWDKLPPEWLLWVATRPGVLDDRRLRLFACRCVRETPMADGRKVWDLLTDPRSRAAVEVAERYAEGNATTEELAAARDAAWDAAWAAAWDAAWDAAWAAAWAAAWDAAWDAARDAARDAQASWLREGGNPFAVAVNAIGEWGE